MKIQSTFAVVTASLATVMTAVPSFAIDWVYMGQASTGEAVYVDRDSQGLGRTLNSVSFFYKLDNEEFLAFGDCEANTWHVEGYDTYSPQSEGTQNMMDYVCQ
ncbi:MAG: hypothetical protein SWY16_08160 [Cyanobacteriota bacterium]|nr:hypothetical protein [Cyanobacteriota bacterium]